jgi:proteasome lid subunit RPN8/RPN11
MRITQEQLDEVLTHVLEDARNELCGVIAVESDGAAPGHRTVARVMRAANLHVSPMRFEIEPRELLQMQNTVDEHGWEIGGIYHSHVRSEPVPSLTDINYAAGWPGVEWLIVGLADAARPEPRSYLIEDGEVREVSLELS